MAATNARRRQGKHLSTLLSLVALLAGAALLVFEVPPLPQLGTIAFDSFQRWHPREFRPAPVRIVDVDDESLAREGQWPWPRDRVAELIERLRAAGAAAIVLDMVFAEPDRTAPARLAGRWPQRPELGPLLASLPDPDSVLADSIAEGGVVTGFTVALSGAEREPPARPARFVTAGDDPRPFLPDYPVAVTNVPAIESVAAGNGAFAFIADADGVVRRVPLLLRMGDTLYPSLAAEALRVAQGASNYLVRSSNANGEDRGGGSTGLTAVRIGALEVPTDPQGAVWLHYSPPVPERYVPAWRVLDGTANAGTLSGHIVLVGTSAKGLLDLRFGPHGILPGVEIHAQLLEQLLGGEHLWRPDWSIVLSLFYLAGAWVVMVLLFPRLGVLGSVAGVLVLMALGGAAAWYAFVDRGLVLDPLSPMLFVAVIGASYLVPRHLAVEQERRWVEGAFARYVSPNRVRHLMANPEQLDLGGEQRECSFVMTDLAGFTGLMERFDPPALVELLNEYLDGMVRIAFRYDGTLDRIVGDAVAVMFSAPATQPDHPRRAVACALEMDAFATAFRERQRAAGIPFGTTRIGVHTGTVLVGNFGGGNLLDYRALGDPINAAARLESVNRHLGTRVCVSADTAARCPGFRGRPVGTLLLKGKEQALPVLEPLSAEACESTAVRAYLAAFTLLEREAPEAEAAFAALVQSHPDDPLAAFHLRRLRGGEQGVRVVMSDK